MSGRYLGFCRGDKKAAVKLYRHGQQLRVHYGVDRAMDEAYPLEKIQQHYRKALHGRSKRNEVIMIERPGEWGARPLLTRLLVLIAPVDTPPSFSHPFTLVYLSCLHVTHPSFPI